MNPDQQQQQPDFWSGLLHAFLSGAKDSALNLRDDLSQAGQSGLYNDVKFPDRLLSTLLSAASFPVGFLHNGDLNSPLMKSTRILRPYGPNPMQQQPQRTPMDDLLRALMGSAQPNGPSGPAY